MKELEDRIPSFSGTQESLPEIIEEDKVDEMLELISHFTRKQKRKVFKPSFSDSVKTAFKKKIE